MRWLNLQPEHSKGLFQTAKFLIRADKLPPEERIEVKAAIWIAAVLGCRDGWPSLKVSPPAALVADAARRRMREAGFGEWHHAMKNLVPYYGRHVVDWLEPAFGRDQRKDRNSLLNGLRGWAQLCVLTLAVTRSAGDVLVRLTVPVNPPER